MQYAAEFMKQPHEQQNEQIIYNIDDEKIEKTELQFPKDFFQKTPNH